jgi:nucleotide-binding universal stress UspA family protein
MKTQIDQQNGLSPLIAARRDFNKALRIAQLRQIWERLTGHRSSLIPFDYLQHIVEATNRRYRGIQAVPLSSIIGSLDRSADFDRSFLPIQVHSRSKWVHVDAANLQGISLPPISLYRIGEAYFVIDGHHRVSVARNLGQTFIDAEVTEVQSRVPVSANLTLKDLDILGPYRDFITATRLDVLRPGVDITFKRPDFYPRLLEHIKVHQYYMATESMQEVDWEAAVIDWYDRIYMPFIKAIRQQHLSNDFPQQTEATLYLWIIEHAYFLSKKYNQNVRPEQAASDFASLYSHRLSRILQRYWVNIRERLTPIKLRSGPPTGTWREEQVNKGTTVSLFHDILVTLSGADTGWLALSQAGEFARREKGVLHGLHVLTTDSPEERERGQRILDEYAFRCQSTGLAYTSSLAVGTIEDEIISRARWSDLVVINQRRELGGRASIPLGTIFHNVAERTARPILAVQGTRVYTLRKLVLAYDGSPKSREALFVMRDLVNRWQVAGVIVTVESPRTNRDVLDAARTYVDQQGSSVVKACFETGIPHDVILRIMLQEEADLLLMGGYGYQPLIKAFLGSTVDRILREAWFPVLICR